MRPIFACLLCLLLFGCESGRYVHVAVQVPVSTQNALPSFPQQLVVHYRMDDFLRSEDVRRVGVLCQAQEYALTTILDLDLVDTGESDTPRVEAEAWLTPVDSGEDVDCGLVYPLTGTPIDPALRPAAGEPQATVTFRAEPGATGLIRLPAPEVP